MEQIEISIQRSALSDQHSAVSTQPPTVKTAPDHENYPAIQAMLVHALEWKREQERKA